MIRIKTLDLLHHGNVIYIFLLVIISSEGKVTIHILQKWCPHAAAARLRLKPRQATTTPGRHLYPKRLPKTEKAAKTLSCRDLQNLEVPLGLGGRGKCHECKHTQLNKLFKQVAMVQGEITKQYSIQQSKHEVDLWYCALTQTDSPAFSPSRRQASLHLWVDRLDWLIREGKLDLSLLRPERVPPLVPKVPLHNRHNSLGLEKGECMNQDPGKDNYTMLDQSTTCIRTSATKKARRVLVIGEALLTSTEAPICCLNRWNWIQQWMQRITRRDSGFSDISQKIKAKESAPPPVKERGKLVTPDMRSWGPQ